MGGKAVAQRVQRALSKASCLDRRAAGGMQHGGVNGMIFVPARKEKDCTGQPPICTQNGEQLRRQHHVAILAALAMAHQNNAAPAVDIGDPERGDFRSPQPGGISGGQCGAALQAGNGFKEQNHFIGAEYHRQFARLSCVGMRSGTIASLRVTP